MARPDESMSDQEREEREEVWRQRFGTEVSQKRTAMGLTQTDLGVLVELSHARISQIEHGASNVPMATIIVLAQRLGIDMNRVFGVPPPVPAPASEPWYGDLLMLRLPVHIHQLWSRPAQQAIIVETLEAFTASLKARTARTDEGA